MNATSSPVMLSPNPPPPFNGPIELVRMIFDTAAQEDKRTASTLMSLCRTTRDWNAPIVYENVVLDNRRAARFTDVSSKGSNTPLHNVKNLKIDCMPGGDAAFAGLCPSVETLTIANYDLHDLPRLAQNMGRLQKVNVKGCMRYAGGVSGVGMEHVMQLTFEDDVPRLEQTFMDRMRSLIHFQCKFVRSKKTMYEELDRCLEIVLNCDRLKKVVIVCSPADEAYLKQRIALWTDGRISCIINGRR
ncbi:hypothetical protein Clacol_005708 [Clathrus columnatus]|uniref:Uncharacterized protein n=1 Tax=Clathrus columnatus TaxID=1419009 RepID=A0AAV5AAV9_9AGAM|nr:hypothetical protein Clacol_005708 [Clathrus columnatus]